MLISHMWILGPTTNARTQRQQMAQMRIADRVRKCLLFGVDRTYRRDVLNDANDPERSLARRTKGSVSDSPLDFNELCQA